MDRKNIDSMKDKYRIRLMNSVTGFKSANLIATRNDTGCTNVAIFSSITHYGSNPPVIGATFRPPSPLHQTYQNIKRDSYYTINQVNALNFKKAHLSSGNYPPEISEFDVSGLSIHASESFPWAPYVKESCIQLGMKFVEEHTIQANGSVLVIGEVIEMHLDPKIIGIDGHVDHEIAGTVCISGLESYYSAALLERLEQVRLPSKN